MRLIGKILLLSFVLMVVMPMLLKGPDGEPIMRLSDWVPSNFIDSFVGGVNKLPDLGKESQIYTWVDENGVLHYSDKPVDGAQAVQAVEPLSIPSKQFVKGQLGVPVSEQDIKPDSQPQATLLNFPEASQSLSGETPSNGLEQQMDALKQLNAISELVETLQKENNQ